MPQQTIELSDTNMRALLYSIIGIDPQHDFCGASSGGRLEKTLEKKNIQKLLSALGYKAH